MAPKKWNELYGSGIVDAYELLREPLPPKSDIVAPSDTNAFNLFDAVSDFVDLGRALAGAIWGGVVEAGGAVGDLANEMLVLSGLKERLAIVGGIAERATGATKDWADEPLNAASDAWEEVAAGGEDAVGAATDIIEEAGSQLADVGDAAEGAFNQAVDFVTSLW